MWGGYSNCAYKRLFSDTHRVARRLRWAVNGERPLSYKCPAHYNRENTDNRGAICKVLSQVNQTSENGEILQNIDKKSAQMSKK